MNAAPNIATIVRLTAVPTRTANLAFAQDGIVAAAPAQVGATVAGFNFAGLYAALDQATPGRAARLRFDSATIEAAIGASVLVALRAERTKTLLDEAIAARENAYYAKYGNQAAILNEIVQFYDPATAGSKPQRLTALSQLAAQQDALLQAAYAGDMRTGVVRYTESYQQALVETTGESLTTTVGSQEGSATSNTIQDTSSDSNSELGSTVSIGGTGTTIDGDTGQEITLPYTELSETTGTEDTTGWSQAIAVGRGDSSMSSAGLGNTSGEGSSIQTQSGTNTDYAYRVPSIESSAQNHRAQISLMDEQFATFMAGQTLPNLQQVFANELAMIDLEVRRRQVAFLDTALLSQSAGLITGVSTGPGEYVKAGETVVRIEDNTAVFLVGTLVCRGVISIGANVTVQTTLCGDPTNATNIDGTVVAAHGDPHGDDWWQVTVSCNNLDNAGNSIVPLRYSFDYDDTTVTIT